MDFNEFMRCADFDVQKWAKQRKKYTKLSESLVRGYVLSHLKAIRLGGRAEAERMLDKLISGKRMELSPEIIEIIAQNRVVWANFIYKIAATLDIEALTGFFVPFIYGGFVVRKNATGESVGVIKITNARAGVDKTARFVAIAGEIEKLRRRGVGIIVILGECSEIYSERMLSLYQGSRNECFVLVEAPNVSDVVGGVSRESVYGREVLLALCRAKNVFVVLGNGSAGEGDILARSRALSSFGILHGVYAVGSAAKMVQKLEKGSCIAVFDDKFGLRSGYWADMISSPRLPIVSLDLFDGLRTLQYISSLGSLEALSETKI